MAKELQSFEENQVWDIVAAKEAKENARVVRSKRVSRKKFDFDIKERYRA